MKFVSVMLVMLFLAAAIFPATVEFKAGINADRIGLDDVLIYTLTFTGINNPAQPDLSDLVDFKIMQTSQSSEFQFVNGVSAYSTHFVYYLAPVRIGNLNLPSAVCPIGGKEYRTRAFQIQVAKGSLTPQGPAPQKQRSPFDDGIADSPFMRRESRVDVQLKARISKSRALKGEQIIFRTILYTTNTVDSVNLLSNQSLEGFWQEWFPIPQTITGKSEMLNGTLYQVFEVRKAALYPTKTGILTIPPLNFQFGLVDPQSAFFGSRPIIRSTPELKIEVEELPKEAAELPVGVFTMDAGADRSETDINGIISLRLKISGTGNIKTLEPPALANSDSYKMFQAKISRDTTFGGESLSGTVTCEIPVSFFRSGVVSFPPFEFRYFNPAIRKIVELKSAPPPVRVTGVKEKTDEAVGLPQSQIVQKGEDVEYIFRGKITDQGKHLFERSWLKALLVLPFLLNLVLVFRMLLWDRWLSASPAFRKRRLLAKTCRDLNGIGHYGEIASILEEYLRGKTGLGFSEISEQRIRERFSECGVPKAEVEKFLQIKTQAEYAKFSPDGKSPREREEGLRELIETIKSIDGKLK